MDDLSPAATETLLELLGPLYDGATEAEPWSSFAECLRRALDAGNVAITLHHQHGQLGDAYVMAREPADTTDWGAVEAAYRARIEHADPLRLDRMTPGEVVVVETVNVDPARRHFLDAHAIAHCLRACFAEPGGMRCWIDVVRRRRQPDQPFTGADVCLLQQLLPHLSRALKLYAALKHQQISNAIHEGTMAHFGLGCALLDGEGVVIHLSRVAAGIVEQNPEFSIARGRIRLADAAAQRALDSAVARIIAARAQDDGDPCGGLIRVCTQHGGRVGLSVQPAPLLHYYQGKPAPCAIVYLADLSENLAALQPSRENSRASIAQLFDLTRQESKLALLLACGLTIAEAATEMNIAESAARNYSKRTYAKIGIRNQTELVRLVYRSFAFLR